MPAVSASTPNEMPNPTTAIARGATARTPSRWERSSRAGSLIVRPC